MGYGYTDTSDTRYLLMWRDGLAEYSVGHKPGANSLFVSRKDGTNEDIAEVQATWSSGDTVTVVAAWEQGLVKISFNGGPFNPVAGTHIPVIATTTFNIGTGA